MKPRASRAHKSILICITAAIAAIALVACGDEEDQSLTFTITGQGEQREIAGPESAESGTAEITLRNEAKEGNDLQLIRVEGDHSAQEVVRGYRRASNGQPFPDWFLAGGGVGGSGPGENQTVTQVLQPGTYYAFSTEGPPDAKSLVEVEVSGEKSEDELPETDAAVTAIEYGFEADKVPSGNIEIDFVNGGAQPHHLIASPLVGDATAEDVEEFFKTSKGKPPLSEKGTEATAVIEAGESQTVTFDLKPGRYAFYCFISDRQGGPPHALKGMVDEFEVE